MSDDLVGHMTKLIAVGLDRIEQLTAERDRLGRELNVAKYGQPDFAWSVHLAAMAEVQAERDRLREAGSNVAKALRLIAGMDLMSASAVAFNAARELEAALKGESRE